jgi:hypothetical protein
MTCATGQQLQSVTTEGVFSCGTDQTGTGGTDLTNVDTDILPEMTGATPLMGNPTGSPAVVSTRNIGSNTQWFSNLWVEDLHVGNQSLYMGTGDNEFKVLESDPSVEMRFYADDDQKMSISTKGTGIMAINSTAADLYMEILGGATPKALNIKNNSTNGTIEIATKVPGTGSSSKITLTSPTVRLGEYPTSKTGINLAPATAPAYTLDVNGDINFTGTLYENGVAFSGGTGGSTSPWETATGGITYKAGSVGIGVTTPVTSLDVSGGKVLAEKFCISTPSATDVCTSKTCAASMESGENGSTCFTQATLTALESVLADAGSSTPSYWEASAYGGASGTNIFFNQTGNVGIGTNAPSAKLNVYDGDVKISRPTGSTLGNLTVAGSIQVGGNYCPAPGASCTKAGEIASCGAGGQILACAGTSSQWMPITSHNGTVVGTTTESCTSAIAGKMRFFGTTTQSLQICMLLSGSSTYSWRTIMSGGGTPPPAG